MRIGCLEGNVYAKKPKRIVAAVDASFKGGMYGCGYIINNGNWGLEYNEFKTFDLPNNYSNFAELWGIHRLFYHLSHKNLVSGVTAFTDNEVAFQLVKDSLSREIDISKMRMNENGRRYTEEMLTHIRSLKNKIDLRLKKPPLHHAAHDLATIARRLGSGSYNEQTARAEAKKTVTKALR